MKLLSIQLGGHDANVTYYNGIEARYILLERIKQVKKYFYHENEFVQVRDDIELLGVDYDNLDAISFVALEHPNDIDWKFNTGPVREVTEEVFEEAFPHLGIKAKKYYRIRHHYAHKRSADWLYGETKKGLVIDGHGDYGEHISVWNGNKKIVEYTMRDMLSVGRLYALTTLMFLKPGTGPHGSVIDQVGKFMGLMSYGEYNQRYADWLRQFSFEDVTLQMYNRMVYERYQKDVNYRESVPSCNQSQLGFPPTFDMVDWSHTWQEVLFDYLLEFCRKHFDVEEKFSFSGGVAHNVCFNERLSKEFPNVVIPPCVGDESLSLGAMYELLIMYNISTEFPKGQFSKDYIEPPSDFTINYIVENITIGKVVTNFQGLGEIGPRALGRRSIFFRTDMMNVASYFNDRDIKNREWWRPYGIIILEEELNNYLDTTTKSPYMLHTAQVKNKEALKGVVHVDNSVRYQTVNDSDGWIYDIVKRVYEKTGVPAIVNTSLNSPGYPIMQSRSHFIKYIQSVPGDAFVIGNEVYENV